MRWSDLIICQCQQLAGNGTERNASAPQISNCCYVLTCPSNHAYTRALLTFPLGWPTGRVSALNRHVHFHVGLTSYLWHGPCLQQASSLATALPAICSLNANHIFTNSHQTINLPIYKIKKIFSFWPPISEQISSKVWIGSFSLIMNGLFKW